MNKWELCIKMKKKSKSGQIEHRELLAKVLAEGGLMIHFGKFSGLLTNWLTFHPTCYGW